MSRRLLVGLALMIGLAIVSRGLIDASASDGAASGRATGGAADDAADSAQQESRYLITAHLIDSQEQPVVGAHITAHMPDAEESLAEAESQEDG